MCNGKKTWAEAIEQWSSEFLRARAIAYVYAGDGIENLTYLYYAYITHVGVYTYTLVGVYVCVRTIRMAFTKSFPVGIFILFLFRFSWCHW